MTVKRTILAVGAAGLLAACGGEPSDDGRSASGEVLEGTISDAMLPIDRVRSEAPLEDPEAFAEVRSKADDAETTEGSAASEDGDEPAADGVEETAPETEPEPAGEG